MRALVHLTSDAILKFKMAGLLGQLFFSIWVPARLPSTHFISIISMDKYYIYDISTILLYIIMPCMVYIMVCVSFATTRIVERDACRYVVRSKYSPVYNANIMSCPDDRGQKSNEKI